MLTDKQEKFVQEFRKNNSNMPLVESVAKGIVVLYLESEETKDKQQTAYMIETLKPQFKIGIEYLLDMKELRTHALEFEKRKNKIKLTAQRRRHDKRNDFKLTYEEWKNAIEHFDCICAYCGDETSKLTYDHVIPFSKGGSFTKDNIIPCCTKCNSSKNDREFEEWYKSKDFYNEERENKILSYIRYMKWAKKYE